MLYALYTLVVLVLIGCDQLLKSWTVNHLALGQSTGFLPGFLQLTRVGNIIDRIANGYVVDMFDLLLFDYPVFNLADCFVVVGVILGAVYYLWFYEKYDARKKDDATDADGDK